MQSEARPEFKPVYILGAGASAMLGAPLLKDFLSGARKIRYSNKFLQGPREYDAIRQNLKKSFDNVFKYQSQLTSTSPYLGIDLDNLEILFSIMDMDWQVKPQSSLTFDTEEFTDLEELRKDFLTLIVMTLKQSITASNDGYIRVVNALAASSETTFITLNYDLAIEDALHLGGGPSAEPIFKHWYGMERDRESDDRLLLKLHGSVNWTYCQNCGFFPHAELVTPNELEMGGTRFHKVGCMTTMPSLVLIPPTWYKTNDFPVITAVWKKAIEQISLATHLVIVGYSMPRTDVFFDQLLTLGLRDNPNLQSVIVINPAQQVEAVLGEVFDRHFLTKHMTFLGARMESLANILGEITPALKRNYPIVDESSFDVLFETLRRRRDRW